MRRGTSSYAGHGRTLSPPPRHQSDRHQHSDRIRRRNVTVTQSFEPTERTVITRGGRPSYHDSYAHGRESPPHRRTPELSSRRDPRQGHLHQQGHQRQMPMRSQVTDGGRRQPTGGVVPLNSAVRANDGRRQYHGTLNPGYYAPTEAHEKSQMHTSPHHPKQRHKVKRQRAGCCGGFNSCCCGGGCFDRPEVINGRPGGFEAGGPFKCTNIGGCCDRERIFIRRGSSVHSWQMLNLDDRDGLADPRHGKKSRKC